MKAINPDTIQSICIFRLSAMGDIVMMVPMLRTLQQYFPSTRISWIISRPMHALLEGMDGVDFIVIDKPQSMSDYRGLKKQLAPYHFDVLLCAQSNLRVNRIYPKIKADIKVGFDNKRSREGHRFFVDKQIPFKENHLIECFMQFAEMLGAEPIIRWDLPVRDEDRVLAAEQLKGVKGGQWLAINPMASKVDRNWPLTRYVDLINQVSEKWDVNIVLTGGPSKKEVAFSEKIETATNVKLTNLVGKTSLKQLAAVFEKVTVLVSPDTGPAHLACAMGTRVVGLFADITPKLSAPYLCQDLVVDRYPEAMKKYKNKSPDKIKWNQRVHHADAMSLIEVTDVLEKLQFIIGKLRSS
jgi:heptosyltransferase I